MSNCKSDTALVPNISVIIPCYNAEMTIERTLNSLSKQTYRNFELLLINDGSTDNSETVIKSYFEKCNFNYKYINQENAGVSVARNVGLDNANGKCIVFLDADDVYHQCYLEILSKSINGKNVDTAYCCYSRDIEKLVLSTRVELEFKDVLEDSKTLMDSFMYRKGPCAFFSFIYKKSIIQEKNIRFTVNSKYGEDLEFTWKYLSHCTSGVFVDIALYGYYDNPNSVMNNISWRVTDALYSVRRIEEYLLKNNMEYYITFQSYMFDRTIWALLKEFSKYGQKDFFCKLTKEQNTKKVMKNLLVKSPNYLIKTTALIYCLNQNWFYYIIKKLYSEK